MISNQTHIRPSPLVTCSVIATKLGHNPLILRQVRTGFSTRIDFSCKLSHRHENFNFPKKTITTTQKRIWPVKSKQSQEEGLRREEEGEKESGELVKGCLSEEEKKKICEFVEGLREEEKKRIFEILMGLSVEEKRKLSETVEEWIGKEYVKIVEFVEGLSEEGKRKIRGVLEDLSEDDKRKIEKLVERFDDEYKKNVSELLEGLSEKGLKRVSNYVVGPGKNSTELLMVLEDLSKEDRKIVEKFVCLVNEEMKEITEFMFGIFGIATGEGEVKMNEVFGEGGKKKIVKFVETLGFDEDTRRNINKFLEELSGEEHKKIKESMEDENEKIKKLLKNCGLSDEDITYAIKLVDEIVDKMSGGERMKAREFLDGIGEEVNNILKLVDLANGFKEIDYKKLINKASLKLLPRLEFIKKVLVHLGFHLLSGIVAYASMKICPALRQNKYFHLFSLPLTSGLLLITTCKGYKDMFSTRKNDDPMILLGTLNAAFGVFLADLHMANSNGIIMLAALIPTLAMFVLASLSAVSEVVVKDRDLSSFEPSKDSVFMVMVILSSFLQTFNRGPITTSIDAGLGALVFSMFAMYDIGKILKRSDKDDDCTAASAHLLWDLSGLFISSIKLLAMLSGLFISIT